MSEWTTLGGGRRGTRRRRTKTGAKKTARTPPPTVGEAPKASEGAAVEKSIMKERLDTETTKKVEKNPVNQSTEAVDKQQLAADAAAKAVVTESQEEKPVKKKSSTASGAAFGRGGAFGRTKPRGSSPLPVTTSPEKSTSTTTKKDPVKAKPKKRYAAPKPTTKKPAVAVKETKPRFSKSEPDRTSTGDIKFMPSRKTPEKKPKVSRLAAGQKKGSTITLTWASRKAVEKTFDFGGSVEWKKKHATPKAATSSRPAAGMNPKAKPFAASSSTPRPAFHQSKSLPSVERNANHVWDMQQENNNFQPLMLENGLWVASDEEAKFQRSLMARLPPKMMGQPVPDHTGPKAVPAWDQSAGSRSTPLYNLVRPYHNAVPTTSAGVHWPLT